MQQMVNLWRDARGATAIEYGLIAALIAVACIGAFTAFADAGIGNWTRVSSNVEAVM